MSVRAASPATYQPENWWVTPVRLVWLVTAIALMVRRSADRMLIVSAFACLFVSISSVEAAGGVWAEPSGVFYLLSHVSTGLFFFLSPTGRFVPRWTALLAGGFVAINFLPSDAGWAIALYALSLISVIALQIYRYRWVSTPV